MPGKQQRASVRRPASRVAAAAAGVCFLLAAIGPAGAQEAGAQEAGASRPEVFRSSASSFVAQAFLDREGLVPVSEAFRFIALDGEGTYESSNQTARSSIFYPGNGVVSGPGLACGTFGSQFPAEFQPVVDACLQYEYPLTVRADALEPDGTSTGGQQLGSDADPVSGQAVRASAHAGDDASRTDAVISDLRVLGLPELGQLDLPAPLLGELELDASVLTVENASSRTHQRIDGSGRLRTDAEAVLDGVALIGGLVEIDSIRSSASIVDDGSGGTNQEADVEISGVTVGGLPAELTDRGLVVGEPTGAGPLVGQLTQLVNQLLAGLDIRISTLGAEHGVDDDGVAFARAGGLLVEFDVDVEGLPLVPGPTGDIDPNGLYQGVIQLGSAGAIGVANQVETPAFTPGAPPATTASTAGAAPEPTSPDTDPTPPPDTTREQAVAPADPAASQQLVVRSFEELWADRLGLVYLAFTLMGLAVCLAPRFALPARFSGVSRES